jgi:hypothetical protein
MARRREDGRLRARSAGALCLPSAVCSRGGLAVLALKAIKAVYFILFKPGDERGAVFVFAGELYNR